MRKADARLVDLADKLTTALNWFTERDQTYKDLVTGLIEQNQVLINQLARAHELLEHAYYNGDIDPLIDAEIEGYLGVAEVAPAE